jgi:transposase
MIVLVARGRSAKESLMAIIGGLDVHRSQITFDWVDRDSGEARRGRITPATGPRLRSWLEQLPAGGGCFAVEGCTGWRFVVEELQRARFAAHLAEPAETASLRGPKRRAKTDRADARHQRELLEQGRLPGSWIPPGWLLDLRTTVRLRKTLADQRTGWQQRIHAVLFHHGLPKPAQALGSGATRAWLERIAVPAASRQALGVALRQVDLIEGELGALDQWLGALARHQPGCRALVGHYGIGAVTAPTILAELGDARRFTGGDQVVRYTGLDITVDSSDGKRSPGHLSRQGPEVLRWARFEAAKAAARPRSPDYEFYQQVKARQGGNRATLAVARKLARRVRHTLVALGEDALAAPEGLTRPMAA